MALNHCYMESSSCPCVILVIAGHCPGKLLGLCCHHWANICSLILCCQRATSVDLKSFLHVHTTCESILKVTHFRVWSGNQTNWLWGSLLLCVSRMPSSFLCVPCIAGILSCTRMPVLCLFPLCHWWVSPNLQPGTSCVKHIIHFDKNQNSWVTCPYIGCKCKMEWLYR